MTNDEKVKCHAIIHPVSVAAGAAGVIPIGPADTLMITPMQIGMIISLGAVFGIRVSESVAKGILAGLAARTAGRAVAKTLLQFIPFFGWAINFATASAITETIGWGAVAHFYDIKENHSKYAGKKEGYYEASAEYEEKFRQQADEFIRKEKDFRSEKAEYVQLLDNLTQMVVELSSGTDAGSPEITERIRILNELIENLKDLQKEK